MDKTQDTFDGLLAEFREHAAGVLTSGYVTMSGRDFHKMLDRFDAAYKREKAAIEADALTVGGIVGVAHGHKTATAENSSVVGDAAKLREAVKCLMDNLNIHLMQPSELITVNRAELDGMVMVCEKALAAPPRNCDVGTAEEQLKRLHNTICNTTKACPNPDWSCAKCFAVWSQTPYEEGGAE